MIDSGKLWWSRLANSVRFIENTVDALADSRSVILNMPSDIPWQVKMFDALEEEYNSRCGKRGIQKDDVSELKDTPGAYLLKKHFNDAQKRGYWPGQSIEKYMAGIKKASINNNIIFITGIKNAPAANSWHNSISEYLSNADNENHCVFVLVLQNAAINAPGDYEIINYGDYVSGYDTLMLCLTILSSERCADDARQYIAEIANEISCGNAEIASILAESGIELACNPDSVTRRAFADSKTGVCDLSDKVNRAVWKAQVKHVFPKLEDYRRELIGEYTKEIQTLLPITGSDGEKVYEAVDVEIGQLVYLANSYTFLPKEKYDRLIKMRNVRNSLAHGDSVEFDRLEELKLI